MYFSVVVISLQAIAGLQCSYASPVTQHSSSPYAIKERHAVPRDWTEVGLAPKSELINLQIGLKQGNQGIIEKHLLEVSDPSHKRYGQHLTATEVNNIISPSSETIDLVRSWLQGNNISSMTLNQAKDWISLSIRIQDAESLLRTKYSVFQHDDGTAISRAPEFSLPLHLHEHIDVIQPTTSFFRPVPRAKLTKSLVLEGGQSHTLSWWETYGKQKFGSGVSFKHSVFVHFSTLHHRTHSKPSDESIN
jgi:tripeptidyl-peptidase-1